MEGTRWPKKILKWTRGRGNTIRDYKRRIRKLDIQWKDEEERNRLVERGERPKNEREMKVKIEKEVRSKGLNKWKEGI